MTIALAEVSEFELKGFSIDKVFKSKKNLQTFNFVDQEGDPLIVEFGGPISTSEIVNSAEFGTGKKKKLVYSIGIEVGEADQEKLELFGKFLEDEFAEHDDMELIDIMKGGDNLYLKLKTSKDGSEFKFDCNLPITPKKLTACKTATEASFKATVHAYVSKKTEKKKSTYTAGLFLTVNDMQFPEEELKRKKKQV